MKTTRRKFIKASALASFGFMYLPGYANKVGANSKLNVGIIGVGGRGSAAVSAMVDHEAVNIVGLCDVDVDVLSAAKTGKKFNRREKKGKKAQEGDKVDAKLRDKAENAKTFYDYREMLDKMGKEIDAVTICTPDHAHYPIATWAMAHGKHCYIEKPLSRTIWEARELKRLAKKSGVITQMGNQGHTFDGWKSLREWEQAGILGDPLEIYHWTNRDRKSVV